MPKLKVRKVVIDNRPELREFSGKVYREVIALSDPSDDRNVADLDNPVSISDEAVQQAIEGAGWSDDDPGVGGAVLLADGRELLNPVPMAPPVNYSNADLSINDVVERSLRMHYERIAQDSEAQETLDELLHFEDDDDLEPASPWEVVEMQDEVPDIPKDPVVVVDPPAGVGVTVVADAPPAPPPGPKSPAA